ncbi:hypothetical protein GWK47_052785 [Chionoecetes opilio]|uniref:Gag-like protein n=1 Tax=Chionoecetes opilio TaxID=41210 RepID=A0A8J4Y7P7_CHIOP|nr:hypothetical protein GWK47_052785 [Chionoecetes opilio]
MVRVPQTEGFENPYTLIDAIEDAYPQLKFRAHPGRDNDFLLHPKDDEALAALLSLTSVNSKPMKLHLVQTIPPKITGIVMGYPLRLWLEHLQKHPQILETTRCTTTRDGVSTRQVRITLEGQTLPSQLDLGVWGTFYLRPFSPEPTRCYRCHAFGHTIYRNRQAKKCGICSAPHDTSICLEKYKRKEQITSCCPNCGKAHHAWKPKCEERQRHVLQ